MKYLLLLFLSFVILLPFTGATTTTNAYANAQPRNLLWANNIQSENGHNLGRLEIFEGQDAVQVADAFVQNITSHVGGDIIGDPIDFRSNLLDIVCESSSISCSTKVPLIYRKTVSDEHGNTLGAVEIYENEEVIDAVVRFLRQSKANVDEIALKNYMFQQACGLDRLLCTRNVAVVFDQMIQENDGSPIDRLVIYENEEPADKVYQWCKDNNVETYYNFIVESACNSDNVICKRKQPVYLSISISDPDGAHINMLELKHGNEPADDIFAFFATNGLFKKKWDFHGMVKQICARSSVKCNREKAVKYFDNNFSMGNEVLGKLVIWEDEEVVDVLYNIRKRYNMTVHDQRVSFNEICKRPEVPCNRMKAIVYKKTEITKLDYEKFGNETCKRQFVGVKYLASFNDLPFGDKISKMLKEDTVVAVVEHPLFCVLLLFTLQILFFLLVSIPFVDKKIHPALKLVAPIFILAFVSILQAVLVEPNPSVDKAMHTFEGKLPDIVVLEGEEPVDALLKWGKEAAKDHHPIVRENIYWELLDELCTQTESLSCTRDRAWEYLDMGIITHMGNEYTIDFYNPHVDPISRKECLPIRMGDGDDDEQITKEVEVVDTCVEKAAIDFCAYLVPPPNNCVRDLTLHIASQLRITNERRFETKCSYKRLGLEMDAPGKELYKKAALEVMKRGMNMSPYARVDNGTVTHDVWSTETTSAYTAIDTFAKIKDPEAREWNDKPCTPYFGGALCAKYDKDGNMKIEV